MTCLSEALLTTVDAKNLKKPCSLSEVFWWCSQAEEGMGSLAVILGFWGQGRKSIDWVRALMCWKLSWEAAAWPRAAIGWSVADLALWLADQSAAPRYRQSGANHQSVIESISDQQSLAPLVTPRSRDPGPDSRLCGAAKPGQKIKSDSSPIVSLLLSVVVIL